jgi:hypothetical protein
VRAYAVNYDFQLWSNFTFFLVDSVNGDQIEQRDRDRYVVGLNGRFTTPSRIAGLAGKTTVGIEGRTDFADVELNHVVARALLQPFNRFRVREQHGSVWVKQDLRLDPRLRLQLGLRGDLFRFDVAATRSTAVLSPKVNLAFEGHAIDHALRQRWGWVSFQRRARRDPLPLGRPNSPAGLCRGARDSSRLARR